MDIENKKEIVKVENLSFTYGCHPVLENISFNILQGEVVGLTGANGAGKTTSLKLITGQLRPQSGKVELLGLEPTSLKKRDRFSYLPQRAINFNPSFPASVQEVVISGLVAKKGLFRLNTHKDYLLVRDSLKLVGLEDKANMPIWSLSGGQQQRVFMARALINKPDLVILDEPTVGLDTDARQDFSNLLLQLNQKYQVTFLIVSHDLEWLSGVINKKICLDYHACSCRQRSNFSLDKTTCFGVKPLY